MPVIGYLSANSRDRPDTRMHLAAFRDGLADNGYVEGQNLAIDYRWAESQPNRLPGFAADLARRRLSPQRRPRRQFRLYFRLVSIRYRSDLSQA
jgi:putative tryptophan/tyrosine transport system substrate-binding protein